MSKITILSPPESLSSQMTSTQVPGGLALLPPSRLKQQPFGTAYVYPPDSQHVGSRPEYVFWDI